MQGAMVVFNCVVGLAIAVALFLGYSDRSWSAALEWGIFYTVGVAVPFWWSFKTSRALKALSVPLSKELRMAPLYPVLAGVMTIAVAIALIREALLR